MPTRTLLAASLLLSGCDVFFPTDDKGEPTDSASTSGSGSTTTNTGPVPPPLRGECDDLFDTPSPGSDGLPGCVTEELACGSSVRGTILGGSTVFRNEPGYAWEQCSGQGPFGDDLSGPERVYRVDTTGMDWASVRLVSCETTQLLWYQTSVACPEENVTCSYVTVDGSTDQSEDIVLSGSGILWFVVEGLAGADGNFELSVECGVR